MIPGLLPFLIVYCVILLAIPALVSMLPLARSIRKTAWFVWASATIVSIFLFWPRYFWSDFFHSKSLWERNPLSLEAFALFCVYLAAPIATFAFWCFRRPNELTAVPEYYRIQVLAVAYAPVLLGFGFYLLKRIWA